MHTPLPCAGKRHFGIVTGAASGIGAATAIHLARTGAGVALVDIDRAGMEAARATIGQKTSSPALIFEADAADEPEISRVVRETEKEFGAIDFLVNCAGILKRSAFLDISTKEWDMMLRINLLGPFLFCKFVVPQMVQRGKGVIINVASLAGRTSSVLGGAHYTAAKHALVGLSRHLARELGPKGLRVNAFCPGATLTPMITQSTPAAKIEALAATIPRRRWATPEEQAAVIGFLVSDAAVNITGACIDSNGGALMV